jgi:hypothetical protein
MLMVAPGVVMIMLLVVKNMMEVMSPPTIPALACIIRERPACGVLGGVRSWQTLMGA